MQTPNSDQCRVLCQSTVLCKETPAGHNKETLGLLLDKPEQT